MTNPILLENYKVDIPETLKEDTIYFRITSKGNSNSFTYLSKYISYFFENEKSFIEVNLAIDDDVENFDLKTLGLLILYCEYLNKKNIKYKLKVFYNESIDNPIRNTRFYNLLNTLIEKPVFLFSSDSDSSTYFETVKKENTKQYSSRTFPFLLINEFTFESLFTETPQYRIEKIDLTQSDIIYKNTSDLTFKKNIRIQINKLQKLNFRISKFDFLLLKFESIFNYSHFTNLFTSFPETVKRFYPKGISKSTYNGNTSVIANFLKNRLLKWNYCKGILFLYLFLSEYEQHGYDKGFSPSKLNKYLNNLESYVDELNVLLREASKNIIKHSSSKMGMITIRLSSDLITSYEKSLPRTQDNLQIGVFDLSNYSVIDKFRSDTENLIGEYELSDPSISEKLRLDLETLKTGYTFKDLLDKSTSKTLLHQSVRMIGHFGLKIIVDILLRNNAILGFSSINNKNKNTQDSGYFICKKGHQEYAQSEWYYCGTGYEIILDTRKKYKEKIIPSIDSNEWKDTDATETIRYLKNDIIEVNLNLDIKTISDKNIKITAKGLELEEIIKKIKAIEFKNQNEKQFLLLDETNLKVKDASELIRSLEKLSYNINVKNLIISGLETSLVTELISLAIMTVSNNWESKNTLLFYHKNDKKQYASILAGINLIETYSAIKLLSNDYLIDSASKRYLNKYKKDNLNIVPPQTSLIKNNNILPFDLFIKSDHKIIYFNFISQLLKEEVENGGYKISGGHFKLGSKAHIEDFIYAQRIFQFSSHSSRFAYLCSEKIKEKVAPSTKKKLLIISYGYYSEMLITKTVNYLKSSYYQVEYNLVSDSSKPYFIRDFTADTPLLNYEVVIVVPIATTLSTAIKIRKHLIRNKITKNLKNNIRAYINFILIAGETKAPNGELNDIAKSFGWIDNIDNHNNTIRVRTQGDDKNEIQQNFFLFIKSTWHLNSDCKLCYPENREEEKVILTTDKTSVNPEFIIKLTKRFKKEEYIIPQDKEIFLPSSAYSRRHIG